MHAVVAVPLHARGRAWGVLDVYSSPRAWDEHEISVARLLANVAVSYLVMASPATAHAWCIWRWSTRPADRTAQPRPAPRPHRTPAVGSVAGSTV